MVQNCYKLSGLLIGSDYELPELSRLAGSGEPDLRIRKGPVPASLPQAGSSGPNWEAAPGLLLFWIPGAGRFLVSGGMEIVVDAEPGVDEADIRIHLLGAALHVLITQRGILTLHASVVAVNGRAIAFAGRSGSGKSTLAAHLVQRGYRILGDDTAVIRLDGEGLPWVEPSYPRIKLWADALDHITHDKNALMRDHTRMEKFHLPLPDSAMSEALPLSEVYLLTDNRQDESITIEPLAGFDAVDGLARNSASARLLKTMGGGNEHFGHCATVAKRIRMLRLRRPKLIHTMDSLIDQLEARWG